MEIILFATVMLVKNPWAHM